VSVAFQHELPLPVLPLRPLRLCPLQAVQNSLHARDNEILQLTRRLDTSRGIEGETELKASAVQVRPAGH
jgi:hypothetical protein